jgi:hypothetical protein
MTTTFPVRHLMCPHCSGRFEMFLFSFHPHYGLLRCPCREYPIVYSIPILVDFDSKELLDLIRQRDTKNALLRTLGIFASNPDFQKRGAYDVKTKAGQERMLQIIDDPLITMQQTLQMLCTAQQAEAMFFRYAHSALVSGVALMALSTDSAGPVLHLGCGAGHLERTLTNRIPSTLLIGVEDSFPFLYAARKYMAPDSHFAMVDLTRALPIQKESFDVVLANERLGQSEKKTELVGEIQRIVRDEDGAVIAACVPAEFDSFNFRFAQHRLRRLSVRKLVERFVKEHAVDATADDPNGGPTSVLATRRPNLFQRKEMEDLVGCRSPRVNPVYLTSEIGEMLKLERRQDLPPSILDPSLLEAGALPERAQFSKQIIKELQDGHVSPEAMDLLFRMVLVDLPLDYS